MESLRVIREEKKVPIDYNGVRQVIGDVKELMKQSGHPQVRKILAETGIKLSNILLK